MKSDRSTFSVRLLQGGRKGIAITGVLLVLLVAGLTIGAFAVAHPSKSASASSVLNANISSSPVIVNNVVYVGSDNNYIYALNASNGSTIWRFDAGVGNETVVTRSVAVANGIVYGSSSDLTDHSYLFAINASTGLQVWRVKVHDQLFTSVQDRKSV